MTNLEAQELRPGDHVAWTAGRKTIDGRVHRATRKVVMIDWELMGMAVYPFESPHSCSCFERVPCDAPATAGGAR